MYDSVLFLSNNSYIENDIWTESQISSLQTILSTA